MGRQLPQLKRLLGLFSMPCTFGEYGESSHWHIPRMELDVLLVGMVSSVYGLVVPWVMFAC